WDRGASIDGISMGNSIQNQATWNGDARINFETLFNKSKYLQSVNKRFSSSKSTRNTNSKKERPKRFERSITLSPDTSTMIKHNLKTKSVKVVARSGPNVIRLQTKVVDENTIEVLDRGKQSMKVTITEVKKEEKNLWKEIADHSVRFLMMPRNVSFRYRNSHSMSLPLFGPEVGDIFGQSNNYGPMSPGLDFAFGFIDESYVDKALARNWLMVDGTQTSPAIWNETEEFNFELNLEPIRGLKILLTSNHTDNRTQQVQFMYADMPTTRSGSFTKTHWAISTALSESNAADGYASKAFNDFLNNIPIVADRIQSQYIGTTYPSTGFLEGSTLGGTTYNPNVGKVNSSSSDVLIPAFLAAYSGLDVNTISLSAFPGLSAMRPNWRITYDGLVQIGNLKNIFKTFTISHAYQCTYSVGSFTSYLNWIGIDGEMGFTMDEMTQQPIPSSPYNISSVAITEKFAPLIGFNATMKNDLTLNAEYRDSRTLTLNSSAGQIVEATSKQITVGAGYKIANFNTILKIGSKQGGVSNDLSLNLDFSFSNNKSLIRKIETAFTQATNGTQTMAINFTASYVLSKRITLSAFFDHQVNTPLVSNSSYPTSNSNYGISINMSLAR
ncbi:MAG: cell surface protein SprA, partial [Muribaculaceae bacterium]|nr:cell surface protein SprA [Muribaculaceae bacterium]